MFKGDLNPTTSRLNRLWETLTSGCTHLYRLVELGIYNHLHIFTFGKKSFQIWVADTSLQYSKVPNLYPFIQLISNDSMHLWKQRFWKRWFFPGSLSDWTWGSCHHISIWPDLAAWPCSDQRIQRLSPSDHHQVAPAISSSPQWLFSHAETTERCLSKGAADWGFDLFVGTQVNHATSLRNFIETFLQLCLVRSSAELWCSGSSVHKSS